jgi:prophage regulatory protein
MQILRIKDVMAKTGLSRASIYKLQAADCFPRSIALSGRAVGWYAYEIDVWLQQRVDARDADRNAEEAYRMMARHRPRLW